MTKFQVIWLDDSKNFCFWNLSSPEGKQHLICVIFSIGKAYFYEFLQLTISKPSIVCTTTPQKHHPLFLAKPPLKLLPKSPFLGNPLLYIGFLWTASKNGILQWTPKILKLFILNTILSFKSN